MVMRLIYNQHFLARLTATKSRQELHTYEKNL
jgi:hypothetical protein